MQLYAEGIQWYDLRCDQQSYSNNGDWRFMNLFIGIRFNSEIRTQNSELVREFDWIRCDLYGADPLGRGCLVLLSLLRSSLHRLLLLLHCWLLLLRPAHITHLQRDAIMKWYGRIKCTVHSVIDSIFMCKLELKNADSFDLRYVAIRFVMRFHLAEMRHWHHANPCKQNHIIVLEFSRLEHPQIFSTHRIIAIEVDLGRVANVIRSDHHTVTSYPINKGVKLLPKRFYSAEDRHAW